MAEVLVQNLGVQGMITLRGDLAVLAAACGLPVPARGGLEQADQHALAWMSPDELLLMVPHGAVETTLASLHTALTGQHFMAVDVSDARVLFALRGMAAREVLAKLAPVDLHPASFGPGQFRRSRLGQVAAAFWQVAPDEFRVLCLRSVAGYAQALLTQSAQDGPVGHFV